jgi:membrane protein DedA with SNARE-associated domain
MRRAGRKLKSFCIDTLWPSFRLGVLQFDEGSCLIDGSLPNRHDCFMLPSVHHLIATYGYAGIALIIGLESMGIPLPGETILVSSAIYAGTTHNLNIVGVIAAATTGAVIGDNIGYVIGRYLGLPVVVRVGPRIGISEGKLKLGRYLFDRYGIAVVFFGRFVAVLRTLAAFLAGVNQMHWLYFFIANLTGGLFWAGTFGTAAYLLGHHIHRFAGPVGIVVLAVAAALLVFGVVLIRRHEARLEAEAVAAYPGPVTGTKIG